MLFLHIGTSKTASTSIQAFLASNTDVLAQRNIIYPQSPDPESHRRFVMYALDDDVVESSRKAARLFSADAIGKFRTKFERRFLAEAENWTAAQTIVISSERLTLLRRESELARLKALLSKLGHEIRIVAYLRRQDHFYLSEYSQMVKGGDPEPPSIRDINANSDRYNYSLLLSPWADAFGKKNLIVRIFEQEQLKHRDGLVDFMALIGISDLGGFVHPGRRNPSLDAATAEFLRIANPLIPRWLDKKSNPRRKAFVEAIERLATGQKMQMTGEMRKNLLDRFRKSNATVAHEYLSRVDGRLFIAPVDQGENSTSALTVGQAIRIAEEMIAVRLGQRVTGLFLASADDDGNIVPLTVEQVVKTATDIWNAAPVVDASAAEVPSPL